MIERRLIRASLFSLLLAAAFATSRSQSSIPFFGIQTHFGQDRANPDTAMAVLKAAGVGAIRDEIYWHEVETSPGVFTFQAKHDAYVYAALARGIQPLIIFDYGHPLYGGTPRDSVGRAAFARYCSTVVARYAPLGAKHYEVWNEPNLCLPGFCPWSPAPDPVEYVQLLREAYAAIKQADSTAVVLAGATSPLDEPETTQRIPGVTFIQRIVALGAGDVCDAISFHQYPVNRPPEDWVPGEVARMRAVAPGRRFWITEAGQHTSTAYGGVSELVQAQWLVRAILLGRGVADLNRLSWYDLQDDCADGANPECRYGILRQDGSPKPAYQALATMHDIVGLRAFAGVSQSNGVYEAVFGSGDEVARIVWTTSGSTTRSVAVPTEFARVRSMLGTSTSIMGTSGGSVTVTVTEQPTYVSALPGGPTMNRLEINPGSCVLDSSQSLQYEIAGWTQDSLRVPMSPSSVEWRSTGPAIVITPGGIATAVGVGEGSVIAAYGGVTDTAGVRVVAPRGSYLVGPMDRSSWEMTTELVDTSRTFLAEPPTGSGVTLHYRFVYRQSNANKYIVRLWPRVPMPIPGRADTLKLRVFGDGQNHVVLFQIADRDGEWFPTLPRRVSWSNAWRPIAARIDPGSGRYDLPARVDEVDLYLVPAIMPTDGSVMEGSLGLDSLLVSYLPRSPSFVDSPVAVARTIDVRMYPNPFNPSTTIRFELPAAGRIRLEVFDLMGRSIALLADGSVERGVHEVLWTVHGTPSGVYVARLDTDHERVVRRLLLLR
ncbi:MAG: T9SS type A sorting domain-containing protein [Bacteroidetes bacterium]|nr:T9SS type A sorting domain-containing protein [Bacteroidota bacterium]